MITVIPFEQAHLDLFEMRDQEKQCFAKDDDASTRIRQLLDISITGTIIIEGRILALFGYYKLWTGVYEVFVFPSIYVKQYALSYLKTVKKYLSAIMQTHNMRRVQTLSLADEETDKWMYFLGFKKEGYLEQYSPDKKDYVQWAIVKEPE